MFFYFQIIKHKYSYITERVVETTVDMRFQINYYGCALDRHTFQTDIQ